MIHRENVDKRILLKQLDEKNNQLWSLKYWYLSLNRLKVQMLIQWSNTISQNFEIIL